MKVFNNRCRISYKFINDTESYLIKTTTINSSTGALEIKFYYLADKQALKTQEQCLQRKAVEYVLVALADLKQLKLLHNIESSDPRLLNKNHQDLENLTVAFSWRKSEIVTQPRNKPQLTRAYAKLDLFLPDNNHKEQALDETLDSSTLSR